MSISLLKLKVDEIDAIYGLIDIAKSKNVKEVCTTTNTTAKNKMKPKKENENIFQRLSV